VLVAEGVVKGYRGGDGGVIQVLQGVDLTVRAGEMIAVVGASGAGKSTFLHVLGALERPDAGHVMLGGESTAGASDEALSELRNRTVGFVFQFHHLLCHVFVTPYPLCFLFVGIFYNRLVRVYPPTYILSNYGQRCCG
jgi:lipoprotein-releasing system ATP-binding protein